MDIFWRLYSVPNKINNRHQDQHTLQKTRRQTLSSAHEIRFFRFFIDHSFLTNFEEWLLYGEYAKYLYLPINEVDEFISSLKETYGWIFLNEFKSVLESCDHVHFKKFHDEMQYEMMKDSVLWSGIFRLSSKNDWLSLVQVCTLPIFTEIRFWDLCQMVSFKLPL